MMKRILTFGLLIIGLTCYPQSTNYREEFNGPFPSWANVKTRFGAIGDGVADDTKAIQTALDSLTCMERVSFNQNKETKYLVIYLPIGTYNISQTLTLAGKIGVTVIGQDPSKTIIRWTGGDNDTMFSLNRSAYLKVSRILWNANNKGNIEAIGLHYRDNIEPNFAPTSIEFSDMIFTGNPKYGISGGTYTGEGTGAMDAEVAIKRCKFYSCSSAGVNIKGFNALDYWIWDCDFMNCNIGVQCFNGNYHVYQSHFTKSLVADIYTKDAYYTSVRGCYSDSSNVFSLDEGASCNAFKRIFQRNFVKDCKSIPIQYHHQGKISLSDNYFVNNNKAQQFTIDYTSWCNGNYDILSIENRYAEDKPYNLRKDFPSTVHSISDRKFNRQTMKVPAIAARQPSLPFVKRTVFEVPPGSDSKAIQNIINLATASGKKRAVIHFPMGNYTINDPIQIPAESDLQLIGDGLLYASVFVRGNNNAKTFSFFNIEGPSYITVKDIQIGQNPQNDNSVAFIFTGIDQPASEVRLDQIYSMTNNTLVIDQLDNTYFEKNNSFFSRGNTIIGGKKVRAGTGTSRLYCFGGQSAGVTLKENATMVAKDCWYEGQLAKDFLPLDLTDGYGNLTVDGALYAPTNADSSTIIKVSNFKGNLNLSNMYLAGSIEVVPDNPELKMMVWNINNYYKLDPLYFLKNQKASKIAMIGITSQCFNSKNIQCASEDPRSLKDGIINIPDVNSFLSTLTKDNRKAMPKAFKNLGTGITNILISRVSTLNGNTSYIFRN